LVTPLLKRSLDPAGDDVAELARCHPITFRFSRSITSA
jgi:hypothetical protein